MTFTFDGDLEISAGDKLAFTGPNAPMGLKLESSEGPYFEVLGEDGAWHKDMKINRLPDTEVLPSPPSRRRRRRCRRSPLRLCAARAAGRRALMARRAQERVRLTSSGAKFQKGEVLSCKSGGVTVQCIFRRVDEEDDKIIYVLSSFLSGGARGFLTGDVVHGEKERSGLKVMVEALNERVLDPRGDPVVVWLDAMNTFTIEVTAPGPLTSRAPSDIPRSHQVSADMLTKQNPTFERAAQWITEHVTGDNEANMLVCLRAELPELRAISSGSFHAVVVTDGGSVLVWGKGSLGRLGLGNELDQLIPTAMGALARPPPSLS
jgi:hypothetical protein